MRSTHSTWRPAAVLVTLSALAGCGTENHGGYDKVIDRGRPTIAMASHPEPPPVVAGAADAGGGGAPVIAANLPAGVTQDMVNEGQKLYGTVCVACHGAGGAGSPAAPALNDGQWLWVPGGEFNGLVNIINAGVPQPKQYPGMMPPKGGGSFTDEQTRAIAAYIHALNNRSGA